MKLTHKQRKCHSGSVKGNRGSYIWYACSCAQRGVKMNASTVHFHDRPFQVLGFHSIMAPLGDKLIFTIYYSI